MHDDFPILAAIAADPAHPFQILGHLQSLGVRVTRSTLYRRVEALVGEGLLEASVDKGPSGHLRRTLRLTEAGRARLAGEVTTVLRQEPLESPLFALALNCAQAADTAALPALLRLRMAAAARTLTDEERRLAATADDEYWSVAGRERRVAHLKADVAWLQSVLGRRVVAPTAERRPGRFRAS